MSSHTFKLVIFDWDGTVVDSADRIVSAWLAAVRDCGMFVPQPEAVRELIGLGMEDTFQRLLPGTTLEQRARVMAGYREHWALGGSHASRLFPGAEQALRALAETDMLLAVATGKSRHGLDREMRAHGLHPLFDASRCADEAPAKPHPGMLLELLEELGVAPAAALMVGDTEYDMVMARAAGVAAVGVRSGVHDESRLRPFSPRAVLDHVGQLPTWLLPC